MRDVSDRNDLNVRAPDLGLPAAAADSARQRPTRTWLRQTPSQPEVPIAESSEVGRGDEVGRADQAETVREGGQQQHLATATGEPLGASLSVGGDDVLAAA